MLKQGAKDTEFQTKVCDLHSADNETKLKPFPQFHDQSNFFKLYVLTGRLHDLTCIEKLK